MRVLAAGACAAAGSTRPRLAAAPRPSAATPPARKFRRAGLAGEALGRLQHVQLAKNLRRLAGMLMAFLPYVISYAIRFGGFGLRVKRRPIALSPLPPACEWWV